MLLAAVALIAGVPSASAHAEEPTATCFLDTKVVYNTCNHDLVIIKGTWATETRLGQDVRGGMTFMQRTWWEDTTAQSDDTSYTMTETTFDGFKTKVRKGRTTFKSRATSFLQLIPASGTGGTMTVRVSVAYVTKLDTGETRLLADNSGATCA